MLAMYLEELYRLKDQVGAEQIWNNDEGRRDRILGDFRRVEGDV